MTNAALIAEQLGLTECGNGFVGFCPCWGYDRGFSVVERKGRPLFPCHAGGCTQQELIQALREYGLWGSPPESPSDLPVAHSSPTKKSNSAEAALAIWARSR